MMPKIYVRPLDFVMLLLMVAAVAGPLGFIPPMLSLAADIALLCSGLWNPQRKRR
jgi:hypothetical protein